MSSKTVDRERDRVRQLARIYSAKGYDVTVHPNRSELPEFLRKTGYIPDLIAKSTKENLLVEVKSTADISKTRIAEISGLLESRRKWRFVLALSNPREVTTKNVKAGHRNPAKAIARAREIARRVGSRHLDVALVYAWAALEVVLADRLTELGRQRDSFGLSLARDATMEGLITRKEYSRLETLFRKRSSSLHSDSPEHVSAEDLNWLRTLTSSIGQRLR